MFKLKGYKHTRASVLEQIDNIKYKCQLPPIAHYKYLNNLQEVSPKKTRTRAISESGEQCQKIVSPQQEREIYIQFLEILNQKNYITSRNWQQLIDHHFQTLKQEEDYLNEIKRYKDENCFRVRIPKWKRRKY